MFLGCFRGMTIRVTAEQKRTFMSLVRSGKYDIGGIAKASGFQFCEAAELFAQALRAKRVEFVDDGPGDRWIREVT